MNMSQDTYDGANISNDIANENIPTGCLGMESQSGTFPTISYVQSKIMEFSNLFNSSYRLALLNCPSSDKQGLLYTLIYLKKSIKLSLEELGKSLNNQEYKFICGLCNKNIVINPNEDFWCALQDHEHFEELYHQFLNGTLELKPLAEQIPAFVSSESDTNFLTDDVSPALDSNTDSGIEQHDIEPVMEPSTSRVCQSVSFKDESSSDENVNSFRFNFSPSYDEEIENKIYPSGMMLGVRKYDKLKDFTIMRTGTSKATCLICHCEMNATRVSKHMLVSHAMGQKHMKAATHPPTLQLLQLFHDFWLKEGPAFQAHEVYFRPNSIQFMFCALCFSNVPIREVFSHVKGMVHARKVLEMYEKRINLYFLIDKQVQLYGITQEQIEEREKQFRVEEEARAKASEKRATKNSDSDTPDEAKKTARRPRLEARPIEHNIIKSVGNPESTNPIDHLPNRMKGDAKYLEIIPNANDGTRVVRCNLCRLILGHNADALKSHIVGSPLHVALKKEQYKYFCEICDIKLISETAWRSHNFSGARHVNMAASRKARVTEYECTTCKTILFGDELSLSRHLAVGTTKSRKERGTKLPDSVKKLFQSREQILAQSALLAGDAEDVLTNSLTKDCCSKLESVLLENFEDCKVYPFGSRISGIGNKDSDLDVFVDIGGSYYGEKNQDPADQVLVIRKAVKAFYKNKEYANIVSVLTARTPILKLHHIPTKLDCDLSFKHGLSVENTKFLRLCLELQPVIQKLILLVKKWAEHIGYESVTTYALAILCIFYLQVNGYLLSVVEIRKINNREPKSINGWKTVNYVLSVNETKSYIKYYKDTVFELLQEFFKYYSKFDFNTYVVCPLLGRVVKRSLFSEGSPDDLPPEMEAYVAQLHGEDPELFRSNSHMCIQDPFDLSHNLTKAVQQGTLTKFQTMCKLSLSHIESSK